MDAGQKQPLRAATRAARRALSLGDRTAASELAVQRLLALPELRTVGTVLLYAALAEELDVGAAVAPLRARGVRSLFPRVQGEELDLVEAGDLRTLQLGHRGIREPVGPVVPVDEVDVVVVPGVAFDPHGGRLGQGGGHYDRLLVRLRPETARIGICFSCQVVPVVPRETHDEPVDLVVTDRAVHRARPLTPDPVPEHPSR
jgi:5-formyltetrahydrofolate cyclo-ligase